MSWGSNSSRSGYSGARQQPKKKRPWVPAPEDGQEPVALSEEQVQKLRERSKNLCLWYLSQSDKTRKQLHEKLKAKNVPQEIIEATLNDLEEDKMINDTQYAENFVHSRQQYRLQGKRAIARDLMLKGVDRDTIAEATAQISDEDEMQMARTLVEKKLASTRGLERNKRINRLVGMLGRKGYSGSVCFSVVREALDAEGDTEEETYEEA